MSDPKRYTFEAKEILDSNGMVCFVGVSTMTHPMGKYVRYEDYARLKAEVERLTKAADLICRMSGDNQVIKSYWKHAKKGGHS